MAFRMQLLLVSLCISCHSVGANAEHSLPSKMRQAVWAKAGSFFEAIWAKPVQAVRAKLSGTSFKTSGRRTAALTSIDIQYITQPIDLNVVMDMMKADGTIAGLLRLLEQHAKFFQAGSEPFADMFYSASKDFLGLSTASYNEVKHHIAPRSWVTTLYKCGILKMDFGAAFHSVTGVMMSQMVDMMLPVSATLEADLKQMIEDNMGSGMRDEGINTTEMLSHISVNALLQSMKSASFDQELGKQLSGAVGVATSVLKSKQQEQQGNSVDAFSNVQVDDILAEMSANGFLPGLSKMMSSTDQVKVDQEEGGVKDMSKSIMESFPVMSSMSDESRNKGVSATSSSRIMDVVTGSTWDDMPQAIRLTLTDVLEAVQDDLQNQIKSEWPTRLSEWLDVNHLNLQPFIAALKAEFRYSSTLDLTLGAQLASMMESAGSISKLDSEIESMVGGIDDTNFDVSFIKMEDVVPIMKTQGFEKGIDKLMGQVVDVLKSDSSKIETVEQEIKLLLEQMLDGMYEEGSNLQLPSRQWLDWADKEQSFACPEKGPGFFGLSINEGSASVQAKAAAEQGNYLLASSGGNTGDASLAFSLRTRQFLASFVAMACVVGAGAMVL